MREEFKTLGERSRTETCVKSVFPHPCLLVGTNIMAISVAKNGTHRLTVGYLVAKSVSYFEMKSYRKSMFADLSKAENVANQLVKTWLS